MYQKAFKKAGTPLVISPVVDEKVWANLSSNDGLYEDSSKALDHIVLQFLSQRSVDFQRCDEALTI